MTYVPHWRVTFSGRLGGATGPEMFSCSFALAKFLSDDEFSVDGDTGDSGGILQPNSAVWTDVASDIAAWFGRPDSLIHSDAVLQSVKVAPIGANGLYSGAPAERLVNQAGGFTGGGRPSNQTALKITLKTNGHLGRVKGGFYSPLPSIFVGTDGLFADAQCEQVESSAATLLNALNNQPGYDALDMRVAVASQGRRSKSGVLVVPPGNHSVTQVGVGRVPDTIRRRRNKLKEQTDYRTP